MDKVKITDTLVYLVWAYQGVLMIGTDIDEESAKVIIHVSIPSNSFLRDNDKKEMAGEYLKEYVEEVSKGVAAAMKFNQGIDVEFKIEEREDIWTRDDAGNAVREMMERMFMGNPFEGVM